MLMTEAIKQAQEIMPYLTLTPQTAQNWTRAGLLPAATKRGRGRGQGIVGDYPKDTVAQIVAAACMADARYRQREIAQAREWVLDGIPVGPQMMAALRAVLSDNPPVDLGFPAYLGDVLSLADQAAALLAGPWNEASVSLEARRALGFMKAYAHALGAARGGRQPSGATMAYRSVWIGKESDRVGIAVSLPGVWINPLHQDLAHYGWLIEMDNELRRQGGPA